MSRDTGVPATPSGSRPTGGAASASPAKPSIPNAGFTPGPWGCELDEGDWLITYGLDLHHGPRALGKVFDYAGEFQEADARLIAAAPELYEALNALLKGCTVIAERTGINVEAECLAFVDSPFAKARRALAKARGEA